MLWVVDVSVIDRSELSQWEGFFRSTLDLQNQSELPASPTACPLSGIFRLRSSNHHRHYMPVYKSVDSLASAGCVPKALE